MIGKLLNRSQNESLSLNEKVDLYFQEYQLTPLFVQENYIRMEPAVSNHQSPKKRNLEALNALANAAEAISFGDLIDSSQRNENSWSLLNVHACISTVTPCYFVKGVMSGMYNFPGWLGQNSKTSKANRLVREVTQHMRLKVSGDKSQVRLEYLPTLATMLTLPMIQKDQDV